MRLSVLFRTHAGSNDKRRPPWFDRRVAYESLRASVAAAGVPATFTFVVDGRLPDELADAVGPTDRVAQISGGAASSSFRACLGVATDLAAGDDAADGEDVVYWFAEDDYLYRPEAMAQLAGAVTAFGAAEYFTLYVPDDTEWHATHPSQPFRALAPAEQVHGDVDGTAWHRVRQTTSTFGVRRAALLEDAALMRLGSTVGAPFDAATWVALQGLTPFPVRHLLSDLDGYLSTRGVAKVAAKPVMRVVLDAAGRRRASRPRVLMAPRSDLSMHLESAMVPEGQGWELLGRAAD